MVSVTLEDFYGLTVDQLRNGHWAACLSEVHHTPQTTVILLNYGITYWALNARALVQSGYITKLLP